MWRTLISTMFRQVQQVTKKTILSHKHLTETDEQTTKLTESRIAVCVRQHKSRTPSINSCRRTERNWQYTHSPYSLYTRLSNMQFHVTNDKLKISCQPTYEQEPPTYFAQTTADTSSKYIGQLEMTWLFISTYGSKILELSRISTTVTVTCIRFVITITWVKGMATSFHLWWNYMNVTIPQGQH